MKSLLTAVLLTVTIPLLQAQTTMYQTTKDRINYSGLSIPATGVLFGFDGNPAKLLGDNYLDTTWQAGNVKFYGKIAPHVDSISGVPIRLDLKQQELEIRGSNNDVRVARAPMVKHIEVNNRQGTVSQFINVREYRGEADQLSGFFEQLTFGPVQLLRHHTIYIRKGNYNPALNVGNKDDELVKKAEWYVGKGKQATKFSPSRKAILELMADKQAQIEAFLKEQKPDLKSASGLSSVFMYYSSL